MTLIRISQPVAEPVTLAEARAHLRVRSDAEDAMITAKITAARRQIERKTRRALVDQTWELRIGCFESSIEIPLPPCIEVLAIEYLDADGALQTLATDQYVVIEGGEWNATVQAAASVSWPDVASDRPDAVRIRFRAGWSYDEDESPSDPLENLPAELREAVLFLLADLYENRQSIGIGEGSVVAMPWIVRGLIEPYVVPTL